MVGASIVFAPIRKYLAWQFPRPAAQAHYKLSPPATFATVAAAILAPIRVTLAAFRSPSDQIRRAPKSRLFPPAAVAASIVFSPVRRYLAWQFPRPATAAHPKLRPPAVVAASIVFRPLKVVLASTAGDRIRHATKSRLYPPVVVAASIVFRPVQRVLAWQFPRPAAQSHWKLSPPSVTGAVVVAFIAAPVKVVLAAVERVAERPTTKSILRAPAVVAASIVFAPVRRYLAWQFPRPAAASHSRLSPPAVTGAVVIAALAYPVRVTLVALKTATDLIRRQPKSKLKPPAAVSASIVFPPLRSELAPSGRQARAAHSRLRPPAAVSASIQFRPIQRTLAWQTPTPARVSRSKLRPPTVVAQFLAPPIRTSLFAVRDAANVIRHRLRVTLVKIGIVSPFVPSTASSYGQVFLTDAPVYELSMDTAVVYTASLTDVTAYTVAIQDEVSYGILGSGLSVYTSHIDDLPAS
jgi:hypothetical protein